MTPKVEPYCEFKGQPVYSKKSVCLLLRISEQTLRRYVATGKIPARRIGPGKMDLSFFEKDIDAFMRR